MKRILFIVLAVMMTVVGVSCSEAIEELEEVEKELDSLKSEIDDISDEFKDLTDELNTDNYVAPENGNASQAEKDVPSADTEQDVSDQSEITEIELELPTVDDSVPTDEKTVAVDVTDIEEIPSTDEFTLDIDGTYTTAEDVSLYIYLYDDLPDNFMTKSEARELGWNGGGLEDYAPGMCIGGDYFGNREGLLPKAKGRTYTECDINTLGEDSRGAERIVFSNDGLIYYTDDHYESFVLLYDEDGKAA